MTAPHLWTLRRTRAALRRAEISPAEYAAELRSRQKRLADLCAFMDDAGAWPPVEPRPTGPLGGVPLAVKDNIDVAGVPTTACTPALRHHTPLRHSAAWRRCAEAGAELMGKTTLHELAYGVTGAHAEHLTARNPVDLSRLAGGSSSGTAAAVAAAIAPAGLGTDTGGSVRIPAALCGVVGFRPSTGRYPSEGVVRISPTRDTVGVLARSVDDVRLLDAVLSGERPSPPPPPPSLPPVLALPRATSWAGLDPEVARVAEEACDTLRAVGWSLLELSQPLYDSAALLEAATTVPLAETRTAVTAYLRQHGSSLTFDAVLQAIASPDVRGVLEPLLDGPAIDPGSYRAARLVGYATAGAALRALRHSGAAAFLSPTTTTPAPPIGTGEWMTSGGRERPTFTTYIRNTAPAAVWGWPSLTVPAGYTSSGLPVGLLLDAPRHHDQQLLDVGHRCAHHLSAVRRPLDPETP
ncbi:amidase family protein [Streptomyces sp. GSL17-111]|uniref:amidase family protein n=1 Tax=Streptomyces sp. GSL17-111 TaxID=3121596 RepID=UPI0030F3D7F3